MPRAVAQSFEEGYQSYMRNQFPVAELQFRAAVKKARNKEDRAFILKFIGICQFMRGDKKSAANSFYEALSSDRNVTIDEEEVLDPGVVSFFNVIKTRWMNSPEGMAATRPAPAPAPVTPPPRPVAQETNPVPRPTAADTKPAATPPSTASADRSKKKKGKESGGRNISWMHFMPFGLGQFYNESYLLGSGFALGQVYSIYQYAYLSDQIDKERAQNKQVADNPNILQAEKDQFLLDNAEYISGLTKDKNSAGTFFVALYVASVAEGLIFAPRTHNGSDANGPETSKKYPRKSINTGWLPSDSGGTYLVSLKLTLD